MEKKLNDSEDGKAFFQSNFYGNLNFVIEKKRLASVDKIGYLGKRYMIMIVIQMFN